MTNLCRREFKKHFYKTYQLGKSDLYLFLRHGGTWFLVFSLLPAIKRRAGWPVHMGSQGAQTPGTSVSLQNRSRLLCKCSNSCLSYLSSLNTVRLSTPTPKTCFQFLHLMTYLDEVSFSCSNLINSDFMHVT